MVNLSGPENEYRIHSRSTNDTSPASHLFKPLLLPFSHTAHTLFLISLCLCARVNIYIYYIHAYIYMCMHPSSLSSFKIVDCEIRLAFRLSNSSLLSNPVQIERRYSCFICKQICVVNLSWIVIFHQFSCPIFGSAFQI